MEEGKSFEHVKQLIEDVVEELPTEDEKFFEDTIADFRISESGADLHPLNVSNTLGFARPVNPDVREEFIVGLNFFQARILSDDAIKGAVTHELGHVKDEYQKGTRRRLQDMLENWLVDNTRLSRDRGWPIFDSETRANNYARQMGFSPEIEALEDERRMIPPEKEVEAVDDLGRDNKSLDIVATCSECSKSYTGSYYYLPHHPAEKSSIVIRYENVPVHRIYSEKGAEPETMISEAKCPDCRSLQPYSVKSVSESRL